ncbi:MAG: hypothetical protein JXR95_03620 [Deltaproteobacteria bacterium]|nr:hypothetical protein [Deltaproteobacteria bacterium]
MMHHKTLLKNSALLILSVLPLILLLFFTKEPKKGADKTIFALISGITNSNKTIEKKNFSRVSDYLRKNHINFIISGPGYEFSDSNQELNKFYKKCLDSEKQIFTDGRMNCIKSKDRFFVYLNSEKKQEIRNTIIIVAAFLITFLIFIFLVNNELNRKKEISELVNFARKVSRGGIPKIDNWKTGDFNEVVRAFAVMTASLHETQNKLEDRLEIIEAQKNILENQQQHIISREKLVTVGTLATGFAHEVGNPVSALIGMHQLLKEELNSDTRFDKILSLMEEELQRIHSLIVRMMEFAAPSEDTGIKLPLNEIIEKAIQIAAHHNDLKSVKFEIDGTIPEFPVEQNVLQVFLNLFINAGQAMDSPGKISVSLVINDDSELILSVEDTGSGIDDDIADNIFEPFFTSGREFGGNGLGLSICSMIMERAQGSIRLDKSSENTRFMLLFKKVTDIYL